jgi:predicted DNA-binding transcriptional regulator YafY
VTPPSLRFLGRKVFWGVVVLLVPVLRQGPTPKRVERLCATFGVSVRTLRRWMRWWREAFAASRFFVAARGRFARPLAIETLPGALLELFRSASEPTQRVLEALRFLAPITTGAGPLGRAS